MELKNHPLLALVNIKTQYIAHVFVGEASETNLLFCHLYNYCSM